MEKIDEIRAFLEREIVPLYDRHDGGHRRDHAHYVMNESQHLAQYYPEVDRSMLLVAAAYHDIGLIEGREHHHESSARMLRDDRRLDRWFTPEQIGIMADAAEDHRASNKHEPRTIYGRLIAESDRQINGDTIIRRTIQYSFANYPGMDREEHYRRFLEHMAEKYAEGGYLKLWIPESDNAKRLQEFRRLLDDPEQLRRCFDEIFDKLQNQ
ncbi:MAG: HD domain-containing protein [Bacteroidales bacterium]|nr:HD domain-containing protein [Candidatus Sodaliphilus aphodohippi]